MRQPNIITIAVAAALSVAFAAAPAGAADQTQAPPHAKKKRAAAPTENVGVLDAGGGYFYGPHYGNPSYKSYWYGPTTGVYDPRGASCYAPRAHPSWWLFGDWYWKLEYIC